MDNPQWAKNKLKRQAAQDKVIECIAGGQTIDQAMEAVSRKRPTYFTWLQNYPAFAQKVHAIRKKGEFADLEQLEFEKFRKTYFNFDTFWHQHVMIEAMEGAGPDSITVINLPPEWGKTTTLEDYICYKLGKDPNFRICVISASQFHSRKIIGRVQRRMTDMTHFGPYILNFGPFKSIDRAQSLPWNADYMKVAKCEHDERDYSLEAKGAGSEIYGARFDLIILDDIQSRQSLNKTESLLEFFKQDVITRPSSEGRIIAIGTRVGPGDFYSRLCESDMVDKLVTIPAINEEGKSNFPLQYEPDGKPMVDVRGKQIGWSEELLERRKSKIADDGIWDRVYMQKEGGKWSATFRKEELDACMDEQRLLTDQPGVDGLAGLDPALGGHTAFVVCRYDSARLYVTDIRDAPGLGRTEDIFAIQENLTQRHRPSTWRIEINAMQKGIARDDRLREMGQMYGFRIEEHRTGGEKTDPQLGIPAMAGSFIRHEISFAAGDQEARNRMQPLIDQLLAWRADVPTKMLRQDLVMALWFCFLGWQDKRKAISMNLDSWQMRAMPYAQNEYQFPDGGLHF